MCTYITSGRRLLVFRHSEFPDAGIQVPGGTIEAGETPETAALREAREETGLTGLSIRAYLGARDHALQSSGCEGTERRHYFHLEHHGATPPTWRHYEMHPSEGGPAPIEFECYWVEFPGAVPGLSGFQGELLSSVTVEKTDPGEGRSA